MSVCSPFNVATYTPVLVACQVVYFESHTGRDADQNRIVADLQRVYSGILLQYFFCCDIHSSIMQRVQTEPDNEVVEATVEVVKPKRGRKQVEVVRKEKFIEESAPVNVASQTEPQASEPEDDIDRLLNSIEETEENQYRIRVDFLPTYDKTGSWVNKTAEPEFCGYIPATAEYEIITQQMWPDRPGMYKFTLIDPQGNWIKKWKARIRALATPPVMQATLPGGKGSVNYFIRPDGGGAALPQQPTLIDQLKSLKETFAEVAAIREALGIKDDSVIRATQPAAPEPPNIQDRIKEKVLDAALDKIIGGGDPERTERVLAMALGHETGSSWTDLLKEAIVSLAPIATQVVGMMIRNAASGQSDTQGGLPQHNGVFLEQTSSVAPALTAGPLTSWSRLCRAIITGYANSFPVDSVALLIDSHGNQFAEDRDRITQLIEAEPAQAISGVLLAAGMPIKFMESNPQFGNYIAELQSSYQDEPDAQTIEAH